MRKSIRIAAMCVVALVLATTVAFAGGQGDTAAAGASSKVAFWNIGVADTDKAFNEAVVAEYMRLNPKVTVEVTLLENEAFKSKLTTVMQSGSPPDVFHSWGGGVLAEYARAGLLRDITKEVQGTAWGNSMSAGVWGVYQYAGKQYGAPYDMGVVSFWYNKDLLSQVGYTSFPATWADLLTLVGKLKAAGITPWAVGAGDKWPTHFIWSYLAIRLGGKPAFENVISGKGTFNDAPFVKAGQMLLDLANMKPFQDGFLGATFDDESALVGNGNAAMELMGQWAPNNQADKSVSKTGLGDKLGMAPFPMVAGGAGAATDAFGGGNGYAVGKNASDAAVDFLRFLTNKDNNATYAATGNIIPTVAGAEASIPNANARMVKAIVDKSGYYQLYLDQFFAPAVGGAINDAVQTIVAGTATPAQAAAAMQQAFDANK